MTPEQLDEIEALAEAQELLCAGSYVLPLVKALREAWQERDAAKEDAKTQGAMHHRYYWRFMACAEAAGMDEQLNAEKIAKIEKERDELRAEVERLKESVANLEALYVSRTDALRESDVEVERLREVVRKVHALSDRECELTWDLGTRTTLEEIYKITKEIE